jgi:hypothetical protein
VTKGGGRGEKEGAKGRTIKSKAVKRTAFGLPSIGSINEPILLTARTRDGLKGSLLMLTDEPHSTYAPDSNLREHRITNISRSVTYQFNQSINQSINSINFDSNDLKASKDELPVWRNTERPILNSGVICAQPITQPTNASNKHE